MLRLLPANVGRGAASLITGLLQRDSVPNSVLLSTTCSQRHHNTPGRNNKSSLVHRQVQKAMSPPAVRGQHGTAQQSQLKSADRLVWVDLEMTGLDVVSDTILEIACLITEKDLQIVAEGPHIVIHQSDDVLTNMGEWCTQQHGKSGLTDAVKSSKISLEEAEQMVLDFIKEYTPKGKCPLAGNSVGVDRSFIERHMPRLTEHLHYRVVDVSSVKELCRRWYPEDLRRAPVKKTTHRAMDDIRDSIAELQFYRASIFK